MKIILASQSLLRGKALEILGLEYQTEPSGFDEDSITNKDVIELAKTLAEEKAKAVGKNHKDALIIAGDLFVVLNNEILGKPKTNEEAFKMLKRLSNSTFDVIAGVAVLNTSTGNLLSGADKYASTFREIKDYEINDYIARYPVTRFAGAYEGDAHIRWTTNIEGNYPFITGFPMQLLIEFLRKNKLKV
ncbi:Maf family protein [Nanoarchaeota archaeon]